MLVFTNGTAFAYENFSGTCTFRAKKMMYNWPLMTHTYVMWAKVMFFKIGLC